MTTALTKGQLEVLELLRKGSVIKSVAGLGSWQSPKCYMQGGTIPQNKNRRVGRETTFSDLKQGGYIIQNGNDEWMTSEWTISRKGRNALCEARS